jgi:hypothetical protein
MAEVGQQKPPEQPGPNIIISPDQLAGVWANFAQVSHSPYEFTLDFARLDFSTRPPQGIVVARVSLSPLMVSQLIEALNTNWSAYAERSMPPEVQQHGPATDDAGRDDPGAGAPA